MDRELTLYARDGCHLCEEMAHALGRHRSRLGFSMKIIDIDGDPDLARRYGHEVPVLMAGETEICRHVFDERALFRHFGQI